MKGSLRENHTPTRHVRITILLRLVGFTSTLPSSEVSNMFSPGGVWENVHRCRSETFTPTLLLEPSSQVSKQRVRTQSRTGDYLKSASRNTKLCPCYILHTVSWMKCGFLCVCKPQKKHSDLCLSHVPYRHFYDMCHSMLIIHHISANKAKPFFDNINGACLWSGVAFLFNPLFSEQFWTTVH